MPLALCVPWVARARRGEQIYAHGCSDSYVVNGPDFTCMAPCTRYEYRSGVTLNASEYAVIKDSYTGEDRVVKGPTLVYLSVSESVQDHRHSYNLSSSEYVRVVDRRTGERRHVRGPTSFVPEIDDSVEGTFEATNIGETSYAKVQNRDSGEIKHVVGPTLFFPAADEKVLGVHEATCLNQTSYAIVKNRQTGARSHIVGPQVYFPPAECEVVRVSKGTQLKSTEYINVQNIASGEVTSVRGPRLWFPAPDEELVEKQTAITLEEHEYVRLMDTESGQGSIVKGEAVLFLHPNECVQGGVEKGVNVDQDQAVVVRNLKSGQLQLITEPQVFIPEAHQEVVKVQERIRLEEYHTCAIKDNATSQLVFKRGPDAFFLPPYCELLEMWWSTGLHKEKRNLRITLFDSRPHYMWHEFESRTKDNVVLILNVTFFWAIEDVQTLVKKTSDPPGDVCSHARSSIIGNVSQLTLEEFLKNFNQHVYDAVFQGGCEFYTERGLGLMGVEVRSVSCKDTDTEKILQDIIQANTNRINRLQLQESENEVQSKKLQGQIDTEKQRAQLLTIQKANAEAEGSVEGSSLASRVAVFFQQTAKEVPDPATRLELFKTIVKKDVMESLSGAEGVKMVFTPSDVDIKLAC